MLGSPGNVRQASGRSAAASGNALKWFARSFFVAAGLVGVLLLVYFSAPPNALPAGAPGGGSIMGGVRGPPLPPRPAHGGHAGHSHGGHGGHDHGAKEEEGHQAVAPPTTGEGSAAKPRSVRVERRTYERDGEEVEEETTFYGPSASLTAAQLSELGTAAEEAAREGADIVVVRRRIFRAAPEETEETLPPPPPAKKPRKRPASQQQQQQQPPAPAAGGSGTGAAVVDPPAATGTTQEPAAPPPPPPPPAKPAKVEWAELAIPTRGGDWTPVQRPIPGEREGVTSHAFEEATQHSLVPPPANFVDPALTPGLTDAERAELQHRLVVAVALGVHHGGMQVGQGSDLRELPIVKVLLQTMLPTAQPHHIYRFYFAYDHNDPVFEKEVWRSEVERIYAEGFAAEDAKRWHPEGSVAGKIDGSRLVFSVHWVHCDYSGKPSWAHSDAVLAAYKEGADYTYRSNDDSRFPGALDWADQFIADLRSRTPIANVGVVGPTCHEGASWCVRGGGEVVLIRGWLLGFPPPHLPPHPLPPLPSPSSSAGS
jgi:hypothetical protein